MTTTRLAPLAAALLLAAGCGGSSAPAPGFAVKGTVSGLAGSNLVLHLGPAAPGQDLAVPKGAASFAFPGGLADGSAWEVTVKTQPASPTQRCEVSGGATGAGGGTIAGADASVTVTCTTLTFPVGGTVSGLGGGTLVLQNDGGGDLVLDANGAFTFLAPVASGDTFTVTVAQQPASPSQTCTVAGGTGTVVAAQVTSVAVTCEPNDKPVAGTLLGLSGDVGTTGVVLTVNGAYDTTLTSSGAFAVLTNLRAGATWTLAVKTQPTNPWQTCTVTPGTGTETGTMGATGAVGAEVTCTTRTFAVGGTASGLLQAGLSVSLSVNGAVPETVSPGGDGSLSFTAKVPSGQAYLVQVEASPPTQVCTVTAPADVAAGTAVMAGAPVDVTISCACATGLGNCDGQADNGCEADFAFDALNCGGCGRPCNLLNTAVNACDAGQCRVVTCSPGYGDCTTAEGCETVTSSSPADCGACGNACPAPAQATPGCDGGACGIGSCVAPYGNCDGQPLNGCEVNLSSSVAHCGTCGHACPAPDQATPGCDGGTCGIGSCIAPYENCDGQPINGCESDVTTDPNNCSACNFVCADHLPANVAPVCTAGTCGWSSCQLGWDDCDGNATPGCESQVDRDPSNCGICNNRCPTANGTAACFNGACTMSACNPGWGDCKGAAVPGCETSVNDDPQNCGGCGNVCVSDRVCSAGLCQLAGSCRELLVQRPGSASGTYTIDPDGAGPGGPVQVYCDMTTDTSPASNGAWTFFAHVNQDYQASQLHSVDVGTYDPARGDGNTTYGLGGTVLQGIVAAAKSALRPVELMISVKNRDPALTLGSSLVFYRFAADHPSLATGPVPCDPASPGLEYRTMLGSYSTGILWVCDATEWQPWSAVPDPFNGGFMGDEPLILLSGSFTIGTIIGSGVDSLLLAGETSSGWDSWWYAR